MNRRDYEATKRREWEVNRMWRAFGWHAFRHGDKARSKIIHMKSRADRIRVPAMLQPQLRAYHAEDVLLIMSSRVGNYARKAPRMRYGGKQERDWVYV